MDSPPERRYRGPIVVFGIVTITLAAGIVILILALQRPPVPVHPAPPEASLVPRMIPLPDAGTRLTPPAETTNNTAPTGD